MADILQKYSQMIFVATGNNPGDKERIDWLYSILTILDTKAAALLSFDALILAAASLMYDKMSDVLFAKWLSLLLIVVSLLAAILSLIVAKMSYSFLGKIIVGDLNNTREINSLEEVTEFRTRMLVSAWWLSMISVCVFIAVVIVYVIETGHVK
jgi:hypothetical protein